MRLRTLLIWCEGDGAKLRSLLIWCGGGGLITNMQATISVRAWRVPAALFARATACRSL